MISDYNASSGIAGRLTVVLLCSSFSGGTSTNMSNRSAMNSLSLASVITPLYYTSAGPTITSTIITELTTLSPTTTIGGTPSLVYTFDGPGILLQNSSAAFLAYNASSVASSTYLITVEWEEV